MTDAATVVWLEAPAPEARETLSDWARARGLTLVVPSDDGLPTIDVDPTLASQIELDLQRAKDAIAKLDVASAELALSLAERTLHDHPALVQGAWLMAEVQRAWSSRWSRLDPRSEERAIAAWEQARALDGGRAASVAEISFETRYQPVTYSVSVDAPASAKIVWDGVETTNGEHSAFEGTHQLRVEVGGRALFASWISISAGSVVHVSVSGARACSVLDLSSLQASGETIAAPRVGCASWVAARALADGSIAVSTCSGESCDPPVAWHRLARSSSPVPVAHHFAWPVWGTWTLVTVGVLAAVGVALGAAGVFSSPSSTTTFVLGPTKIQSHRVP